MPLFRGGLPPGQPVDRRAALREALFGLAVLALAVAAGLLGAQLGRLAAPTVVRWQIERVDEATDAPPRPPLPRSPFEG
ncbi:hypothetical protein ACFOOK_06265 [Micromonospora krabiensis]|nr:hypothetical protein [Micromonospora krabiensis]